MSKQRTSNEDREVATLRAIVALLEPLSDAQKARLANYVIDRYDVPVQRRADPGEGMP